MIPQPETTPGRSRLTRKGAQTRRRIVAAAAELIFEQGVANTTIGEVRAAAGVSSSQLYHYFEDKDALVRAVIEQQTNAIVETQAQARLDSLEGFRAWRDRVVERERAISCRGGCPIGSLGSELAERDPDARAEIANSLNRWEAAIREGLSAMHADGRLAPDTNPEELALATLAALQGGLLLSKVQRDIKPLETALDAMVTLIGLLSTESPAAVSA